MEMFIWFLVTTLIGELLRPKPKDQPAASLGDFQFPTAEDGRAIPIICGTVRVSGANIVWYGDLRTNGIRASSGLLGGSTVVGTYYSIGFQAALALGPVDALVGLEWDDKPVPYSEATVGDKLQLTIDQIGLFGGRRSEGGVVGVMDFYLGTDTQTENDYLLSALGLADLPGYRNVAMAISRQMYIGTSNYPKTPAWILRSTPNTLGLTTNRHIINGRSANPAAFLYWVMTEDIVGMQIPAAQIDIDAFRAVGNTLHAEGFGVNFQFDSQMVAGELVDEVLRHVDGFKYIDPETGLLGIGLVRDDYDPDDLLVLDGSNIIGTPDITEPSWAEQVNYITVEYLDTDFKKRAVPYPNLAAIERRGEIDARTYQYLGIDDGDMAAAIAARLVKRHAYPLKAGTMVANREAWRLREGSVFVWSGYPFDIPPRVMRVVEIDNGDIQSGEIRLTVVEDIFSVDSVAYLSPGSEWDSPVGVVQPVAAQTVLEVPYQSSQGSEDVLLWALGVRSGGGDLGAEIWTDRGNVGSSWRLTNDVSVFCPSGLLTAAYDPTMAIDATGFTVDAGTDLAELESISEAEFDRGQNLALIGDELFAWRDVTDNGDGTWTFSRVIRAVFDTVPRPHADNDRVYFLTAADTIADPVPIVPDQAVGVRLLPYNGRSTLAFGSASTMSITTQSRASRPYPPGRFRIGGSYAPGTIAGDLAITWSDRNRIEQLAADVVVEQDTAGSFTAEGDYQLQFWIAGSVRRTENVAGESFTYTTAMRSTDYAADLDEFVEVRGYGRTGGALLSRFYQSITVDQNV